MIVIDTSAWVEFLRDTDSTVCNAVDDLLGTDIVISDVISRVLPLPPVSRLGLRPGSLRPSSASRA
jgi:hypothetical protein